MKLRHNKLGDIAEVRAGYPFRKQIQDRPEGDTRVIQMKNIDEITGIGWNKLSRTDLEGKRSPDWMQPEDIVFAARGNRNFAVCLDEVPEKTVCSPHFYQLHVRDTKQILPAFLTWQINQAPAQQYFAVSAEGSMIRSIRRGILESLPVVIPSMEQQTAIVELDKRVKQEHILLKKKIDNSRAMMNAIARELFNEA